MNSALGLDRLPLNRPVGTALLLLQLQESCMPYLGQTYNMSLAKILLYTPS